MVSIVISNLTHTVPLQQEQQEKEEQSMVEDQKVQLIKARGDMRVKVK